MAAWGKVFPPQLRPVGSNGFFTFLYSRKWGSLLGSAGHIFSKQLPAGLGVLSIGGTSVSPVLCNTEGLKNTSI